MWSRAIDCRVLGLLACVLGASAGFAVAAETTYGLGPGSEYRLRFAGLSTACGSEITLQISGRVVLDEDETCNPAISSCAVSLLGAASQSGFHVQGTSLRPFGFGALGLGFAQYHPMLSGFGSRQLDGRCANNRDQVCASSADCAGASCSSHCFANPATECSVDADCPLGDSCRTRVVWSVLQLGTPNGCTCCQDSAGAGCIFLGASQYPTLQCDPPVHATNLARRGVPDWLFEGGPGTPFAMASQTVSGQTEGVCALNRSRPCGVQGDVAAGGACDDTASGGVAGDSCDLSEDGLRGTAWLSLLADGSPNPSACAIGLYHFEGTPGGSCSVAVDIVDGDPQPGCPVLNMGTEARPDLDCNGVDDTLEGRCAPDGASPCGVDTDCPAGVCVTNGDLCPFYIETTHFADSNWDGRGDQCQCADFNSDGQLTSIDIAGAALCANGVIECAASIADADGDASTTQIDVSGVIAVLDGNAAPTDMQCLRVSSPTP